ncbi:MAG TPA: hypothetical protein DEV93_10255 [Chloroflexi bacterium]|jgi:hypothetical protein|nr:hypothetical protein [Chloroflexota bacterium]
MFSRRLCLFFLIVAGFLLTPSMVRAQPISVKYVPAGWPVQLIIPKLRVAAPIEYINMINGKNALHAPFRWQDVAWHFLGPRPGEPGHAAIFGHLDSTCCPAVFYHLKELRAGDTIEVAYPDKRVLRFRVIWLHDYANTALPKPWLFALKGQRGLVLGTCAGDFHRDGTGYDHKLVVYSRLLLLNGRLG